MLEYWTYEEAGKRLPVPKSRETVRRWATEGLRGVILETVWVGGTPCVTAQSLGDFANRLTAIRRGKSDE